MVTDALDHQGGTRVAHREPFAGLSPQEHLTRRGPVADRVPGDHLLRGIERRGAVGAYDDPPAREALADVVVGVALEAQRDPLRHDGTEGLACGAREQDRTSVAEGKGVADR